MPKAVREDFAMARIACPLTGSTDVQLVREIPTQALESRWRKSFEIDIHEHLKGVTQIRQYYQPQAEFHFFAPTSSAGSGTLYEALAQFPWYYIPHKWEHEWAQAKFHTTDRILEIGCGQADFIHRLKGARIGNVVGLELNAVAAESARGRGLDVRTETVQSLENQWANHFDFVCAFQVLEHIPDPRGFLLAAQKVLRPGGELLLSVPNARSFLQFEEWHLLDLPPHHMSRWSANTFAAVATTLDMELLEIKTEPLAAYHAKSFAAVHLKRFAPLRPFHRIGGRLGGTLLNMLPGLRRGFVGHTLCAALRKRSA